MTTDAEDRSTWRRNGQVIRRDELLRLIEENGGSDGLDLRGALFVGDRPGDIPVLDPIDLSRGALAPLAEAYREANSGSNPPWLADMGDINLGLAQLQGADLASAQLEGADLAYAHLQGANLESAQLQGANLLLAQLQGADLGFAQLQGAVLWHSELLGAVLSSAQLQGASLNRAQLQGAGLQRAKLQGAVLGHAQLEGADLRQAQLQDVDMYDVASLEGAHWYSAVLDHTRIMRESLGKRSGEEFKAHDSKEAEDYHYAKEAYLLLKNNFNQIGRYEDASWAYVKEQQMEKMALYWEWRTRGSPEPWEEPSHTWQFWRSWGSFLRWVRNWAYELLTGYGERVHMPLIWAVVVIALFAVVYAGAGNIATGDVGALEGQATHSPITALVHSISAFATIGFNTLEPLGWGARLLTAVEAMFGIGLFALFVFTIGNRMSRG